jgi:protein O-GlcNAc transferase
MTLIEALRLAVSHHRAGRTDEAAAVCRAVLAAVPEQPETRQLLGVLHFNAGRSDAAQRTLRQTLAIKPDMGEALGNMGLLAQREGRLDAAATLQTRALALNPAQGDAALLNRGAVRQAMGDRRGAEADYLAATRLNPGAAQAFNNLGAVRREIGYGRLSIEAHRRALALAPGMTEAWRDLGHVLREAGLLALARDAYGRAFRLSPAQTENLSYHMFAKQAMCEWRDWDDIVARIGGVIDHDRGVTLPLATLAIETTLPQQQKAALRFYRSFVCAAPDQRLPDLPRPKGDGRLRVAYASADFCEHATAYLAAEMFELHDRSRFKFFAYSYSVEDDTPMRRRLRDAFEVFHDIGRVGPQQVAAMAAADGIDILVDLKGYTKHSRLDLLTRRLAPVQATYLGYPGPTGCELLDYVIGDRFVTPPEHQPFYTEKLVILPDSYQINDRRRPIAEPGPSRAECGLPPDAFVFCSFNTTYKITPMMFGAWMRLLRQVPGSVLWLFEANDVVTAHLRGEAQARGVDPARLVFAPKKPLADHLARYRLADLFVDTFPYTGHTTTSDALWAGLPVVTLQGDTFASRVAAGLLAAAGAPELIAASLAEYEALALRLAGDPATLSALRRRLIETRMTVPLFDSRRFTRHIERAYETMWSIHQAGEPPRGFTVPPLELIAE